MTPFTLKAFAVVGQSTVKGNQTAPYTEKLHFLTDIRPRFKQRWGGRWWGWGGEGKTCGSNSPGVRKNATDNLAYILAPNTSYESPAITIAVKLAFCARGTDHVVFH